MIALVTILPTLWELWNDRNGETRKDKARDFLIAVCLYAGIALALWWMFETNPLKSLALMLGVRVMLFDYAIAAILIRRGVIVGRWFSYNGKTARFDRLVARVNPWVRFAIRLGLFVAAIIYYYA